MSDREHAGGCPAVGFEHLAVGHWTGESFPVSITHLDLAQVDRDLGLAEDDPAPEEAPLRKGLKQALERILEWIDRRGHATANGSAIRIWFWRCQLRISALGFRI